MSDQLIPFQFETVSLKNLLVNGNGEVQFVVRELANILGYSKETMVSVIAQAVPEEWKGIYPIDTPGGKQNMLCLSEQGLYFFLARSDKPKALPFQKWIAGTVVPSIRNTGAFSVARTPTHLETARNLVAALERAESAEQALAIAAPKVAFAEAIQHADQNWAARDVAKSFGIHPQKRLVDALIKHGWYRREPDYVDKQGRERMGALRGTSYAIGKGFVVEGNECIPNGREVQSARITVKGRAQLAETGVWGLMYEGVWTK